jgi:hypothetical protein
MRVGRWVAQRASSGHMCPVAWGVKKVGVFEFYDRSCNASWPSLDMPLPKYQRNTQTEPRSRSLQRVN